MLPLRYYHVWEKDFLTRVKLISSQSNKIDISWTKSGLYSLIFATFHNNQGRYESYESRNSCQELSYIHIIGRNGFSIVEKGNPCVSEEIVCLNTRDEENPRSRSTLDISRSAVRPRIFKLQPRVKREALNGERMKFTRSLRRCISSSSSQTARVRVITRERHRIEFISQGRIRTTLVPRRGSISDTGVSRAAWMKNIDIARRISPTKKYHFTILSKKNVPRT